MLTQSTTLTDLGPGAYSLTVPPAIAPGAVVSTLFDPIVTGSPAAVTNGSEASATVSFLRRPGTGAVWSSATYDGFVYAYTDEQLRSPDAGNQPAVSIDAGAMLNGPESIVFDAVGNLWAPDNTHNRILRYDVALLDTSGSPPPSAQLLGVDLTDGNVTWGSLANPEGLAFDRDGNLWVTTCGSNESSLLRYAPAQLVAGGAQLPEAIVRDLVVDGGAGTSHTIDCVYDLAFEPLVLEHR